jgi:hypothetical protein
VRLLGQAAAVGGWLPSRAKSAQQTLLGVGGLGLLKMIFTFVWSSDASHHGGPVAVKKVTAPVAVKEYQHRQWLWLAKGLRGTHGNCSAVVLYRPPF